MSTNTAPQITAEEDTKRKLMIANVFFRRLAPGLANPFTFDAQGRVLDVGNTVAFDLMRAALARWAEFYPGKPMAEGRIVELIATLDLKGLKMPDGTVVRWPHVAQIPPRVEPPAPPKKNANDLNNERIAEQRRRDSEGDSPIKGVAAVSKPKPTEAELVQAAEAGLAEEAAAQSVIHLIAHYSPQKYRGAITEEKAILARVFDEGKAAGKTFVQLESDVRAQIETMAKWDNREAIRQNWAATARAKGIDLMKRQENKYAGDDY